MRGTGGIRLERRPGQRGRLQRWRGWLSAGAALVLFAGYALLLGRGAAWLDGSSLHGLTSSQRASEIDTMRGYLIQVGAGVLAAGALLYTALNFQLAREGHVTDRYTKAIEQLGSDRLDVRLGAIYALERIMIDSARDHPTIVEVLAAFIREHAPLAEEQPRPATDIQAAARVLGRRPVGRTERGRLDLRKVNLAGADLTGADLTSANLAKARLTSANLTRANLDKANLVGAMLNAANLSGADLNDANLTGANLANAEAIGVRMNDANLTNANLGAVLIRAGLRGAILSRANLVGANLTNALLTDAELTGARLSGADLTGVKLTKMQRRDASLMQVRD